MATCRIYQMTVHSQSDDIAHKCTFERHLSQTSLFSVLTLSKMCHLMIFWWQNCFYFLLEIVIMGGVNPKQGEKMWRGIEFFRISPVPGKGWNMLRKVSKSGFCLNFKGEQFGWKSHLNRRRLFILIQTHKN